MWPMPLPPGRVQSQLPLHCLQYEDSHLCNEGGAWGQSCAPSWQSVQGRYLSGSTLVTILASQKDVSSPIKFGPYASRVLDLVV